MFAILAGRLHELIPFDDMAIYSRCGGILAPEYASGPHVELLSSLEIQVGQGLSGWVARNSKAILNGNPSVDLGETVGLKSALAIPLEADRNITGVLTLFHAKADAFSEADLRHLSPLSSLLADSQRNELDTQSWSAPAGQAHSASLRPLLRHPKETLVSA
jgi:GAF domain-containing protein